MKTKSSRSDKTKQQSYLIKLRLFYKKPLVQASTNLVFTLLVICFFVLFAIRPTLVTIVGLQKKLEESQEVDQKLTAKIRSLEAAQKAYGKIIDNLYLVEAALPQKTEFKSLALRINFLAFQHNLILDSAGFAGFDLVGGSQSLSSAQNKNSYKFNLTLNGSFANVKSFLTDLENIDRLIKINRVSFKNQSSQAGESQMQVEVAGEAYWLDRDFESSVKEQ